MYSTTRGSIAGIRSGGHTLLSFNEDVPNIVCCYMNSISDTRHTENTLLSMSIIGTPIAHQSHTSVDPGSIPSLAFSRAPLASCISLIFEPCFPITEPMRELGIMNLMVTARLPGTEGTSNGSSLMRRTMRPKAYHSVSRIRPLRHEQVAADLGYGV